MSCSRIASNTPATAERHGKGRRRTQPSVPLRAFFCSFITRRIDARLLESCLPGVWKDIEARRNCQPCWSEGCLILQKEEDSCCFIIFLLRTCVRLHTPSCSPHLLFLSSFPPAEMLHVPQQPVWFNNAASNTPTSFSRFPHEQQQQQQQRQQQQQQHFASPLVMQQPQQPLQQTHQHQHQRLFGSFRTPAPTTTASSARRHARQQPPPPPVDEDSSNAAADLTDDISLLDIDSSPTKRAKLTPQAHPSPSSSSFSLSQQGLPSAPCHGHKQGPKRWLPAQQEQGNGLGPDTESPTKRAKRLPVPFSSSDTAAPSSARESPAHPKRSRFKPLSIDPDMRLPERQGGASGVVGENEDDDDIYEIDIRPMSQRDAGNSGSKALSASSALVPHRMQWSSPSAQQQFSSQAGAIIPRPPHLSSSILCNM